MSFSLDLKKSLLLGIIIPVAVLFFGGSSHADSLDNALNTWEDTSLSGRVMEIGSDYIIVSETKVLLINARKYEKIYKTKITDIEGNTIYMSSLDPGKKVFIKGSVISDEDNPGKRIFVAREIYLLTDDMSNRDIKSNSMLNSPSSAW